MQISFDFIEKRIVLDGAEDELLALIEAVRKIAPSLPQITINSIVSGTVDTTKKPPAGSPDPARQPTTMREYVRAILPKTHHERIAAIGYFVRENEGKANFSPKDMDGWYTACGFQKPSSMSIALNDGRKVRYVTNSGYGQWKVDRDGENWVIGRLNRPEAADDSGATS